MSMNAEMKYRLSGDATVRDALIALNKLSGDVQNLFILDQDDRLIGTLTDGDIRRKLLEGYTLEDSVTDVMHTSYHFIRNGRIDLDELRLLKEKRITLVPNLDDNNRILRVYNLEKQRSILPVDAVLMAGGKGERLRPLTETTPKPLLKVGEKAIIDYNVDALISYGVENIFITVNYLKEQIIDHFGGERENVSVQCISEPAYLGTMGSVRLIGGFQNDTVLIMNSDLFTNIDYERFYAHFIENDADLSVAAIPYSVTIPYGILDLEEGDIRQVLEKPTYHYYANAGIYLVKRQLLENIPAGTYHDATDFIQELLSLQKKVIRFPLNGYWIDIGKPEDYKKAQDLAKFDRI